MAYGDVTIFGENELVEKRKRGWKNKVRMMRGTTKWLWPIVKHEPDVKHDPEDNVSNSFTKKINTLLINDCQVYLQQNKKKAEAKGKNCHAKTTYVESGKADIANDCAFFLSFFWWVRTPVVKMKNENPLSFAVNKGEVHTLPFHNTNSLHTHHIIMYLHMHHPNSIHIVRDLQARIEVKKEIMGEEEYEHARRIAQLQSAVKAKIKEASELRGRFYDIALALECGCCFERLAAGSVPFGCGHVYCNSPTCASRLVDTCPECTLEGPGHRSSSALWGIVRRQWASRAGASSP